MDLQTTPHPAVQYTKHLRWPTRLALLLAEKAGATGMFYFLVIWYGSWITLATLHIGPFDHDRYPFPMLLFCSNAIQLVYLPLLQIKSKFDAKVNDKANTHLANVLDAVADYLGVEPKQPLPTDKQSKLQAGSVAGFGPPADRDLRALTM